MKWKILFLCLLASCGPRYIPPAVNVPCEWKAGQNCTVNPCVENWWDIFEDPCLNELEYQALSFSPELYIAYSRIVEARATAGVRKADLYPQVILDPHYTNQGRLFKIFGVEPGTIPGLPNTVFRIHQLDYYFPFDMSYEIDLWGRLKKIYMAAKLEAEATYEDFLDTLLLLTTDLASYYFNIRTLDAQILYYQKQIALDQKNVQLIQLRYEDGLISYLDVASANLELSTLKSNALELVRQRQLFENALAVLIGKPASEFCLASNPLETPPPCISPGVPCSILAKRPDIREAEREREASHLLVGAAYNAFLPSLTITGALGFYSPTLRDFLTWKSRLWQIGGAISQTILDGGRKVSNLHVAWAQFHKADGTYQQTVLNAFREVEDALSNIDYYNQEYEELLNGVFYASKRFSLSQERYEDGLVNYLEVLDSERSEVTAQINTLNALGANYQSTIQLIKSIGGSWQECCCFPFIATCGERKIETSIE